MRIFISRGGQSVLTNASTTMIVTEFVSIEAEVDADAETKVDANQGQDEEEESRIATQIQNLKHSHDNSWPKKP